MLPVVIRVAVQLAVISYLIEDFEAEAEAATSNFEAFVDKSYLRPLVLEVALLEDTKQLC